MKTTPVVLILEATIAGWFTAHTSWQVWATTATRRHPNTPSLLALHTPTHQLLAIHARPRRLHPSENPNPAAYPPDLVHVVWHTTMRPIAGPWIAAPLTPPPGLLTGTWQTP